MVWVKYGRQQASKLIAAIVEKGARSVKKCKEVKEV